MLCTETYVNMTHEIVVTLGTTSGTFTMRKQRGPFGVFGSNASANAWLPAQSKQHQKLMVHGRMNLRACPAGGVCLQGSCLAQNYILLWTQESHFITLSARD